MRVLVTGACGYVGSTLVPQMIHRRWEVVAVDRASPAPLADCFRSPEFAFHRLDVRDLPALAKLVGVCDAVVPLAALVGMPLCERLPKEAAETNWEAVRGLVGLLSPQQAVVYPCTNSGYGTRTGEAHCTEETPLEPVSVYGRTKVEGEKAVLAHPLGVSLRLATVFGTSPRMRWDLLANRFTAALARDGRVEVFEPHFRRNFVHVYDVARAVQMAVEGHLRPGPYNCGNPHLNMTKLDLAHFIRSALMLPRFAVAEGDGADPDRRDYVVDNSKLVNAGFGFLKDLRKGVREMAAYARALSADELAAMSNA